MIKSNLPQSQFNPVFVAIQLWRAKAFILFITILFVILGSTYLVFAKERWISKATITYPSSGQIANYTALLNVIYSDNGADRPTINDLQHQVFNRFSASLNSLASSLASLDTPIDLRVEPLNKGDNNYLSVSLIGSSAKDAQEKLDGYITKINNNSVKEIENDITYNVGVRTKELSNIVSLNEQIAIDKKNHRLDVINQALKIADATSNAKLNLNQVESLSDDTLYLLGSDALRSMVQNEATKPLVLDDNYYSAKRALLAVTHIKIDMSNVKSFRYISNPDLPIKRISPQRSLVLILSAILGVIFGSVIVISRNNFTTKNSM
ncbi:LPS O-antigen chain length determinant protein WzzB [Pantoea sp. GM01]|uniref:LPS O-antigen chain length determinant protein WzzB n=1 Tax=Pantoea sp. GM01 TaxID=1144320 RepID=UPI0002714358|nr:LPS O-antigen chain length determinant protein WzzB [Pantoea sp. GM01]EJL89596.1 chain length determinant protein [Pantoea sp. GM01]